MRLYRCCDVQTGTCVFFRTAEKAFDWIISRRGPWQKYQPWPRNVNHLRIALRESKQEPAAKKPTIIIPWWENIGRKIL